MTLFLCLNCQAKSDIGTNCGFMYVRTSKTEELKVLNHTLPKKFHNFYYFPNFILVLFPSKEYLQPNQPDKTYWAG
jgi:hypothetical protein